MQQLSGLDASFLYFETPNASTHIGAFVAQFGMGPVMDGMGLIHPVSSYNGKAVIAFTSCRRMLPDPDFYEDCLRASLADLSHAVLGSASADLPLGATTAASP